MELKIKSEKLKMIVHHYDFFILHFFFFILYFSLFIYFVFFLYALINLGMMSFTSPVIT